MSSSARRLLPFVLLGVGLACSDTRSVSLGGLARAPDARPAAENVSGRPSESPTSTGRATTPTQAAETATIGLRPVLEDAGVAPNSEPAPVPRAPAPPAVGVPARDAGRAPSAPSAVDDEPLKGDDDDEREYEREAEDDDDDDSDARKDVDEAEEEAREDAYDDDDRSDER